MLGQTARLEWRKTGNSALLLGLAGPASGPVQRVWFLPEGGLAVRTDSGRVFVSRDMETWSGAAGDAPAPVRIEGVRLPEGALEARGGSIPSTTLYAFGDSVWRSDDAGGHWQDMARFRGMGLLGGTIRDLAIAADDAQRVVVATDRGVWLSLDGGQSWESLNESLPNLPVRRLLGTPRNGRGLRMASAGDEVFEWLPGQKLGWTPARDEALENERTLKQALEAQFGTSVTAIASSGDTIYAGSRDGRLFASQDRGRTWRVNPPEPAGGPPVEVLWLDPVDPRTALAGYARGAAASPAIVRTVNAGAFWDDLTSNLPAAVRGIAADPETGAIYVATSRGVFWTMGDLRVPAAATAWTALAAGWPEPVAAADVRLDASGRQLYSAVEGYGIFAAPAPHRPRRPLLVHTADYEARAAAPGSLLSLLGARATAAQAGGGVAPLLAASEAESQIQVPFGVRGESLDIAFRAAVGALTFRVPLRAASPSILVDRDGTPMLMDAGTGVQIDALNPVRPGMRLQILATGLGRVTPDWPAGLPAPIENPPAVTSSVVVRLDGAALEVERATLAPGYIGFYLVEVRIPELINAGAATLEMEASGQPGNRVRLYAARN
jgi:uncharacterized protein (TIGR03437 family)